VENVRATRKNNLHCNVEKWIWI